MNKSICTLIAVVMLSASCDSYLDVKPYGRTIPKTPEEFSALIHTHLNNVDEGATFLIDNATRITRYDVGAGDDFEAVLTQQAGRTLPVYIGSLLNGSAYEPYINLYRVIKDCNIVIGEIQPGGTDLSTRTLSTAYALRGVAYYQLLRLYCEAPQQGHFEAQAGVPLVTSFDMTARPIRSSMQQTVSRIEEDLNRAVSFQNTDALYLFTADVVKAYLARLYFWTEQWQKALDAARELQARYPLLSGDEYKEMIAHPLAKKYNHILTAYGRSTGSNDSEESLASRTLQYRPVSKRFINCFQNGEAATDIRYALCLDKERKAVKPFFCGIRGAELKLIEAEALAHLGQTDAALKALNELRAARITGATPYTLLTLPEANPDERIKVDAEGKTLTKLMGAILNERRKELFLEGDRMFELKRNGTPEFWTAYNGLRYNTLRYMYTFPIPESEIRINPAIIQNAGYTELLSN